MKDITEKEIEQYVRFPQEISEEQWARIKKKIDASQELQEIAQFFKEYDEYLDEAIRASRSINIIPLTLFKPEQKFTKPNRLILAAQTKQQSSKLQTVATLSSEENETVVRILSEKETDKCRIHVLSNRLENQAPSILSFQDIGTDLVIGKDGRLRFEPDFNPHNYDWSSASFALRLSLEQFIVRRDHLTDDSGPEKMEGSNCSLRLESEGGKLLGTIIPSSNDSSKVSRIVVKGKKTGRCISPVMNNSFSVPVHQEDNSVTLWLFE